MNKNNSMVDQNIGPNKRMSSFSFDVLKLLSGAAIAQALIVLAMPLLTRLYTPELFGLLSVFTGITSVLTVFVCMSYEYAIVLPEEDSDAANLLGISIGLSIVFSLLTIPFIWIWGGDVSQLLNVPALVNYLWLLPLSTFLSGLFAALSYWSSRTKHFGRLSVGKITQSLVATLAKLGAGYAGYATGGVMIGTNVGGQIVATSILGAWIWRDNKILFNQTICWQGMLDNAKRYYKFPVFYMGSNFVNTLSSMTPVFLFSFFFSPVIVGHYSLSLSALQAPMSLLGSAIGQVFFQKVFEARQQGQLATVVEKIFSFLVVIGMFPIMMMTLIGRDFFVVVFGQDWAEAGVYTQFLAASLALLFVTSPLTVLTAALEKQRFALITSTILLILRSIGLIVAGIFSDARLGILLFSLSGVLVYVYRMFVINKFAGVRYRKTAEIAVLGIIPFMPAAFLFWILKTYNYLTSPWIVVTVGIVCMVGYMFYIFITQKDTLRLFVPKRS